MNRRGRTDSPISLFSFQDIVTSVTAIIILITMLLAVELTHRVFAEAAVPIISTAAMREAIEDAQSRLDEIRDEIANSQTPQLTTATPESLERESRDLTLQSQSLAAELEQLHHQRVAAKRVEQEALAKTFDRETEHKQLDDLRDESKSLKESIRGRQKANEQNRTEIEGMKEGKKSKANERRIYNPAPGVGKQAWLVDVATDRLTVAPLGKVSKPIAFSDRSVKGRVESFTSWAKQRSANADYFVLLVRPAGIESFDALRQAIDDKGFDMGFDLIGKDEVVLDAEYGAGEP